jgi:4-alpha-glucanotransferase
LHLGSDARMNTPAATHGNWTWRYHSNALHPDFAAQLAALMEMSDRDGYVPPVEDEESKPALEAGKEAGESQKQAQSAANV